MIWSSRERNRSCSPLSPRSRGRIANPSLHKREREEARLATGNPENRICKETARRAPKTGKFDYLSAPNHRPNAMIILALHWPCEGSGCADNGIGHQHRLPLCKQAGRLASSANWSRLFAENLESG